MSEDRADAFLNMIKRSQRGKLKIYLGYVAGVGKTYEMLQEAHRLKKEGIDAVVGLVETHGRADTAKLVEGLEVVPRRRIEYRGVILDEMDVDAILARKPQIVLVDELAHTNVPGSRNAKRFEDVQEILDAGIHVISTLNIQHLESLYDVVEQATGVKVRERIPDCVLAEADQLVNVDLTYQDLQERLKEGKIYPKERIATALQNFFKKTNLDQLRELALREMAAHIDLQYRDRLQEEISATPDQVMVCLSSRGPNSEKLLRYASRLAEGSTETGMPFMFRRLRKSRQRLKPRRSAYSPIPLHWLSNLVQSFLLSKVRILPRQFYKWRRNTAWDTL